LLPEYWTPEVVSARKRNLEAMNEAARHAENLLLALRRMSEGERENLISSGAVTVHQVEHLSVLVRDEKAHLSAWAKARPLQGAKNLAAHDVAGAVRKLFRKIGREITFGQRPEGGPSTDFGRAVEVAIGAFGIRADWRRPAEAAVDR